MKVALSTERKALVDIRLDPSRTDGGWGMSIPMIISLTEKAAWDKGGSNIQVSNNSTKALRLVVYDATPEWEEDQRREREKVERKQLATLKKKYEAGK